MFLTQDQLTLSLTVLHCCLLTFLHCCSFLVEHSCSIVVEHSCLFTVEQDRSWTVEHSCCVVVEHCCSLRVEHSCSVVVEHCCSILVEHCCSEIVLHCCSDTVEHCCSFTGRKKAFNGRGIKPSHGTNWFFETLQFQIEESCDDEGNGVGSFALLTVVAKTHLTLQSAQSKKWGRHTMEKHGATTQHRTKLLFGVDANLSSTNFLKLAIF